MCCIDSSTHATCTYVQNMCKLPYCSMCATLIIKCMFLAYMHITGVLHACCLYYRYVACILLAYRVCCMRAACIHEYYKCVACMLFAYMHITGVPLAYMHITSVLHACCLHTCMHNISILLVHKFAH